MYPVCESVQYYMGIILSFQLMKVDWWFFSIVILVWQPVVLKWTIVSHTYCAMHTTKQTVAVSLANLGSLRLQLEFICHRPFRRPKAWSTTLLVRITV